MAQADDPRYAIVEERLVPVPNGDDTWLVGTDEGDENFLADPAERASFVASIRDAVRQGPVPFAPQYVAQLASWGFRLEDISTRVHVWAGANDRTTSPEMMKRVVEKIPDAAFTVWPDAGHAGIAKYFRDVLSEI
jgi:pimeloyl-ACP methyl ester carboxylesterase